LDWNNKQTVGNTFTPTKNGLLIANAGGGGGTYVQIVDVSANLSLAISMIQSIGNASANCIISKNRQVKINTNGTVSLLNTFIPFK
jgi:flagellar basal body rod protein FlgF